jgi:hypothetical protein
MRMFRLVRVVEMSMVAGTETVTRSTGRAGGRPRGEVPENTG